ncbi:hypothetical protein D3C86_2027120 [compost metagenome]
MRCASTDCAVADFSPVRLAPIMPVVPQPARTEDARVRVARAMRVLRAMWGNLHSTRHCLR